MNSELYILPANLIVEYGIKQRHATSSVPCKYLPIFTAQLLRPVPLPTNVRVPVTAGVTVKSALILVVEAVRHTLWGTAVTVTQGATTGHTLWLVR